MKSLKCVTKIEKYQAIIEGQPVNVNDMRQLYDCSIFVQGAQLAKTTQFVCDLSDEKDYECQTLILDAYDLPVRTTRTSQELLADFEQQTKTSQKAIKESICAVMKVKKNKFPFINHDCLLMKLSGSARRNTSMVGLTYLDNLTRCSCGAESALLTFHNGLEIIIPITYRTIKVNVANAVEYDCIFHQHESLLAQDSLSLTFMKDWTGSYCRLLTDVHKAACKHYNLKVYYLYRYRASSYEMFKEMKLVESVLEYEEFLVDESFSSRG